MCPSAPLEVLPNRKRYCTVAATVKLETWRNKLSETSQVLLLSLVQGLAARAT